MIPKTRHPERAFSEFIERWFELLASGRAEEACATLDEPNDYGIRWTPRKLNAVLRATFGAGTVFAAEHPEGPRFSAVPKRSCDAGFYRADDGTVFVDYPVPLNGDWSDLTAQFEFHPRKTGWAVVLHDLHVL